MSNINQHAVLITFFPDEYAFSKDEENWTLPVLADEIRVTSEARKDRLPFLKLARFGEERSKHNCLRWNPNVQTVTGVEIDYDIATMPFDTAIAAMKAAAVRCLLYTSASYVAGKKEKWRVLVPFSKAYPPKHREEMVAVVNGILGGVAAEESFTLSQSFYYGCVNDNPEHRVEVIDGDFVDLRPDLRPGAIGRAGKSATKAHIVHQDNKQGSVTPGRDEAEILALIAESRKRNPRGGGQWHDNMLRATASMVGKGWTDKQIYDVCAPYCDGQWGDEEIRELIEDGRAKWKAPDPDKTINAIAPVVAAAIAATGKAPVFAPLWREMTKGGRALPSLHNARLAIEASGVMCSEDVFHGKMYMGRSDASSPSEPLASYLGEVTDGRMLSLRLFLSDRYGFDLTEKHVRDAVLGLARENAFDPICDMLDEAEANWDGVERLDRMAAEYFNAEDTRLNRQCVRKTMLAAVARARQPGCKFDTILTLESREGWNKSSSFRVLAGDDNFSDASIIGRSGREVQEQLAGVWIHENPDLAGLKKAEVETVKAFASRQEDRARPAYGRFMLAQPRRSIEIGTTNSRRYMQSQTGNRRFWPLEVLAEIDLGKLRRDRLQLWGEAARRQREGEGLTLDRDLWGVAGNEQELRRVQHPWEALLAGMTIMANSVFPSGCMVLEYVDGFEPELRVHTKTIFTEVLKIPGGQLHRGHAMTLAEVMKLQGWENKETRVNKIVGAGYVKKVAKKVS